MGRLAWNVHQIRWDESVCTTLSVKPGVNKGGVDTAKPPTGERRERGERDVGEIRREEIKRRERGEDGN